MFPAFLNEAPMSGEQFRELINNSDIQLGFELEFLCKKVDNKKAITITLSDFDKDGMLTDVLSEIKQNYPHITQKQIIYWTFFDLNEYSSDLENEINEYYKNITRQNLQDPKMVNKFAKTVAKNYIEKQQDDIFDDEDNDDLMQVYMKKFKQLVVKNPEKVVSSISKKFNTFTFMKSLVEFFDVPPEERLKRMQWCSSLVPRNGWLDDNNKTFLFFPPKYEPPKYLEIAEMFTKKFGIRFSKIASEYTAELDSAIPTTIGSGKWELHDDGSVIGEGKNCELVSPPLPINEALNIMQQIFEFFNSTNGDFYTNYTCGFHMGISFKNPQKMKDVDKLKFMIFLDDRYVLEQFERLGPATFDTDVTNVKPQFMTPQEKQRWNLPDYNDIENYAISSTDIIIQKIRQGGIDKLLQDKSFKTAIDAITKKILSYKYQSINFKKLSKKYIEVRAAGGEDYTKNFSKMKNTALRYAHALIISADPEAYKTQYYKKLYTLIMNAFGSHKPEDNNTDIQTIFGKYWYYAKPSINKLSDNQNHNFDIIKNMVYELYDKFDAYVGTNIQATLGFKTEKNRKELTDILYKFVTHATINKLITTIQRTELNDYINSLSKPETKKKSGFRFY